MRVALLGPLVAFATALTASAAPAAPLPSIDMCAVDSSGYTVDLNDNGFVAKLDDRIVAGTVTCDRQVMNRLGAVDGRTYLLSQAWFTDHHDGPPSPATVAQISEIDADGHLSIVYRESLIVSSDTFAARLVEQDGKAILAVTTPVEHFFVREANGFAPLGVQWEIPDEPMAQALPPGDLLPTSGGRVVGGDIVHFNLDSFSLDVPIAVASEVFPRTYADPDYDRPLTLRFPLVLKDRELVPGTGEVVEPDQYTPNRFGETPEFLSIPKDVKACEAHAWLADEDPLGVAVRAAPSNKGAVIATLPAQRDLDNDLLGAEVTVIGSTNGWFLIGTRSIPPRITASTPSPLPGPAPIWCAALIAAAAGCMARAWPPKSSPASRSAPAPTRNRSRCSTSNSATEMARPMLSSPPSRAVSARPSKSTSSAATASPAQAGSAATTPRTCARTR